MVITVTQTASNVKQSYLISSPDGFGFTANAGNMSSYQDIVLSSANDTLEASYSIGDCKNNFPFIHIFGVESISRAFRVTKNGTEIGRIARSDHGFLKSYYVINLNNDKKTKIYCYFTSAGSFDYVSIYLDGEQIALIETFLNVDNYKYTNKLYLLDDHTDLAQILSLFTVYYSSFAFSKRFHMTAGTSYVKKISFSRYSAMYDKSWRETNFPNENFFGKLSLFD